MKIASHYIANVELSNGGKSGFALCVPFNFFNASLRLIKALY